MDVVNKDEVKFSLKAIKELNFSLIDELDSFDINEDTLDVKYYTQTFINIPENRIVVEVGVKYNYEDCSLVNFELSVTFLIDDLDTIISIDHENKKLNTSFDFIPTFLNISIGTIRGALYEKLKDTILYIFPLPLLSNSSMVQNNNFHIGK